MRIRVELSDEQKSRLLALAGQRGLRGISSIIQEALNIFLNNLEVDEVTRNRALSLRGSLSAKDASLIRKATGQIRSSWR